MTDSEKKKMTAKQRQLAKIEQLKTRLQNEEAKLRSQARKDRDGQLIALGIFLERFFKTTSEKSRKNLEDRVRELLSGRNLDRALAAFERLSSEMAQPKKEISPEPPSQLPEAEAQEKNQGSA